MCSSHRWWSIGQSPSVGSDRPFFSSHLTSVPAPLTPVNPMISCSGRSIKLIVKVILTGLKGILTTGSGGWVPRASSPQTTSIPPLCLGNRSIPQTLLGNMSALCTLQIVPCNIFQTVSSVRTPCRQRLTAPCYTARLPNSQGPLCSSHRTWKCWCQPCLQGTFLLSAHFRNAISDQTKPLRGFLGPKLISSSASVWF